MQIIKSSEKSWQDKAGYSKKILFDEINKNGVAVQEVKIKAGETAQSHYHKKQTEIFYFLNSNGYWVINGEKFKFEAGEVLVIKPGDKHEVVNKYVGRQFISCIQIRLRSKRFVLGVNHEYEKTIKRSWGGSCNF